MCLPGVGIIFWVALPVLATAPRLVLCSISSMWDWRFLGPVLPALALFSLVTFLLVFGGVLGASTPADGRYSCSKTPAALTCMCSVSSRCSDRAGFAHSVRTVQANQLMGAGLGLSLPALRGLNHGVIVQNYALHSSQA